MPGPFALVDCNNFYASCERLFQPELRGRPVVVLSNNDGCVIARSNEAKALGIEMGEPWHLAKERFEKLGVIVRSSNYSLYGDLSARVMTVLARFSPELEVYSIDEAFLGLRGFQDMETHAREIVRTVYQLTGIPVSVGIAPTKTLAKLANRLAKKDPVSRGVRQLMTTEEQVRALSRIELTDIWGIAGRLSERLTKIGIDTPLDLRNADANLIRERFGVVILRIAHELRGHSCLRLEEVKPDRKSIIASRSFGQAVLKIEHMREAVVAYASRAAEKMRRQHLATGHLVVFMETNPFRTQDPQRNVSCPMQLPVPTSDTGRLAGAAVRGLEAIWKDGYRYKKAGIMLLDLTPAARVSGGLFDRPDSEASKARMRVMDQINRRFGRDTVAIAGAGIRRPWKLRRERLSKRYTTCWDELLEVPSSAARSPVQSR